MDNSIYIVNLPGLFVLSVGDVDIKTYLLTKYCNVIERAYFNYTGFFIRKPFFCQSLNFRKKMLEIRLRFP